MPPHADNSLPPAIDEALGAFTRHRNNARPISMAMMLHSVRYARPDIGLSDPDLSDRIPRKLIELGCIIDFDSRPQILNAPSIHYDAA